MLKKSKIIPNKLIIALAMVGTVGLAHAELTPLQTKVLNDHNSMKDMSGDERRTFRGKLFNQENQEQRIAYNSTYKKMSMAGLLPKLSPKTTTKSADVASRAPGTTIIYDNGVNAGNTGQVGFGYGNRFNSGFNPGAGASGAINPVGVGGAGTVTMATFSIAAGDGAAFYTIGTNIVGSSAATGFVGNTSTAVGMNTKTLATPVAFNGEFLGSVWQSQGGSGSGDVVGADAGTVNGQGFHGLSFDDSPITGIVAVADRNAIFRVTGTNLLDDSVPVELMNFSID